ITPAERDRYLDALLPPIVQRLVVRVNGVRETPRVARRAIEVAAGQNGLSTLRVLVELAIDRAYPPARDLDVSVEDLSYAERAGWREIGATDSDVVTVTASSVPRAKRPLDYRGRAFREPPRIDRASFRLHLRGGAPWSAKAPAADGGSASERALGRLASAIRDAHGGIGAIVGTLALAFVLGAGHAFSPGHGKTLLSSYLVGSRATARHAVWLGIAITFTHTISVWILGGFALAIERQLASDRLLRVLELGSGALVAALALSQLPQRVLALRRVQTSDAAHAREHAGTLAAVGGMRALFVLSAAGGLLPCPSALVVLLVAIAAHRIGFGLALVSAFSVGLAAVLVALGIASVLARAQLERFGDRRALAILPVLSSLCVFALGIAICLDAYARR
ncbi:MAG TPA: hypothetical protein VGI70_04935, partial [Polyangiales bacterium]